MLQYTLEMAVLAVAAAMETCEGSHYKTRYKHFCQTEKKAKNILQTNCLQTKTIFSGVFKSEITRLVT